MDIVNGDQKLKIQIHSPASVLLSLQAECDKSVEISTSATHEKLLGGSYVFLGDLESWQQHLRGQSESALIEIACSEYLTSVLNLCQGQYRNSFKGLRLVLELSLQSVYLSANLVLREEWLKGEEHTFWALLVDVDNGPLSQRFCRAFFPALSEHVSHFRELARTLYTELSECIHGNIPSHIPLPSNFSFSEESFKLWHKKADTLRLIVHFAFTMRHFLSMSQEGKDQLESMITEQLGHIQAIRNEFNKEFSHE